MTHYAGWHDAFEPHPFDIFWWWTTRCKYVWSLCTLGKPWPKRRIKPCCNRQIALLLKGAESPERRLDKTALFLHCVVTEMPKENGTRSTDGTITKRCLPKTVSHLAHLGPHRQVNEGSREKCIQAGASNDFPKPVNPERLFSMLRRWLYL